MILERGKPTKDICSLSHGESAGVRGSYERVSPYPVFSATSLSGKGYLEAH